MFLLEWLLINVLPMLELLVVYDITFVVLLWGIASVEPIGFGSWGGSVSQHGGVGGAGTLTPTWHEEVLWSSSWVGDLGKVTPLSPFLAVSFCSERR